MTTIAERVPKGVKFLDRHDPEWWKPSPGTGRPIHLDTLDLAAPGGCVLGQRCPLEVLAAFVDTPVDSLAVRDFWEAYEAYAEHLAGTAGLALNAWAHEHGFLVPDDDPDDYAALTAEWRRVIEARRAA